MSDLSKRLRDLATKLMGSCHDGISIQRSDIELLAEAAEALAKDEQSEPIPSDGWLQDGSLLYRLTDESKPQNRDEISVTMADGSRSEASRTRRAGELLDRIRTNSPRREPLTDEQVGMLTVFPGLHHVETPVLAAFIRHIEQTITGGKT